MGEEVFFFLHGTAAPGGLWPPHYRGSMVILKHTTIGNL